jgi:hypothetical protein
MLKKAPVKYCPDWAIIFILPAVGVVAGWALLTKTYGELPATAARMLGFCDGVAAFFAHQIAKQLIASPFGAALCKIPLFPVLIAILGIDPPKEEVPVPTPQPTTPTP